MVSIVVWVVVVIWFFRGARAAGRNGLGWALVGTAAYGVPTLIWEAILRFKIVPTLLEASRTDGLVVQVVFLGLLGIALGIVSAVVVFRMSLSPAIRAQRSAVQWTPETPTARVEAGFCPGCGAESSGAGPCPACGEEWDPEDSTCAPCAVCEQMVPVSATFCPYCRYERAS
jgi:hypothetical protein